MMGIDLKAVARVYLRAAATSRKPIKTVADEFGVSQSTATRRVRDARDAGLIPEDVPTTNPYLPKIAAELGVTVEALERAIAKHAPNGNLRVIVSQVGTRDPVG
jgi:DNA-binding Lrp family transcriptional regulator